MRTGESITIIYHPNLTLQALLFGYGRKAEIRKRAAPSVSRLYFQSGGFRCICFRQHSTQSILIDLPRRIRRPCFHFQGTLPGVNGKLSDGQDFSPLQTLPAGPFRLIPVHNSRQLSDGSHKKANFQHLPLLPFRITDSRLTAVSRINSHRFSAIKSEDHNSH